MKNLYSLLFLISFSVIVAQQQPDTLVVAYSPAAPFVIKEDEFLEGINVWLWQQVAKDMEWEYQLKEMPFAEMLAAIKSGEVDVCINPLTITSDRVKEMGFSRSFFASHSTIAVPKKTSWDKVLGLLNAIFTKSFLSGFLILFLIILFFGLLIWLFERKKNPEEFRKNNKGIWDGLWWSAVTLTTVGYGDKAPKTKFGKLAALGLMLIGLLFISGLTASIASSLTVNRLSDNIKNFNEFKERSVGTINGSSSYDFLRVHFFKDISQYSNVVSGLKALDNKEIDAFIYDEPILKYRLQKDANLQNLEILPMKFDVQFYGFGVKPGDLELQQAISQQILEIIETTEWEVVLNEYGLSEL